uniref:Uncharacterized protein At3g50630 n=1 Tax=Arabidopsis thaliana TaxID=3702 RepID=Q0WSW3_ARATH|nr:hypothetical protein [Arabidopsis thaliana]
MAAVRRRERDVVEENGVTTTTVKRRKMEEEVDLVESRIILSPCVQATNRGGIVARNSASETCTHSILMVQTKIRLSLKDASALMFL